MAEKEPLNYLPGKLRLLKKTKHTNTIIKPKHVEREIITDLGGTIIIKSPRGNDGDLLITRRLAQILFNKDWGKPKR
jgi:hypothetical protein